MKPVSDTFRSFLASVFNDALEPLQIYLRSCESVPAWLASDRAEELSRFRDELAAHIRDSSYADSDDPQWLADEHLRDLWFDAFGPTPPPDDPFPVDAGAWGHTRLTPYLVHGVGSGPDDSSPGASAWLERRGLTFADVEAAIMLPTDEAENVRSAPQGWPEHLGRLTDEGRRDAQPGEVSPS